MPGRNGGKGEMCKMYVKSVKWWKNQDVYKRQPLYQSVRAVRQNLNQTDHTCNQLRYNNNDNEINDNQCNKDSRKNTCRQCQLFLFCLFYPLCLFKYPQIKLFNCPAQRTNHIRQRRSDYKWHQGIKNMPQCLFDFSISENDKEDDD